jgi:hypothetical protein
VPAKLLTLAFLLLTAVSSSAQSLDANAPSPVRTNRITGEIAARDLGDSRLTNHYYAFTGTPGDLLITVQSNNLNGDIDVFTATSLRPLLKISLYAEIGTPVTKTLYLRKREDLILRVEARTPNDDEGTYRLFFGGSFEPIFGGEIAEAETPEPDSERIQLRSFIRTGDSQFQKTLRLISRCSPQRSKISKAAARRKMHCSFATSSVARTVDRSAMLFY